MTSASDILCHRCGRLLTPGQGEFYIVRIEAFADPAPPNLDSGERIADADEEWRTLLAELSNMSERELMDQVHRRLTLHLCLSCYRRWIENPAR